MHRKKTGGMFQKWTFTFFLCSSVLLSFRNWGCIGLSLGPTHEEGLGVVDMEHDPRQRGEGARRWRGGGGKPTLGCLRAAGRFSRWGLPWRPGDGSSNLLLRSPCWQELPHLSGLYFQGPSEPLQIRKGPKLEGRKRRGPHLRWGPVSTRGSELPELPTTAELRSEVGGMKWEASAMVWFSNTNKTITKDKQEKTFSQSKKIVLWFEFASLDFDRWGYFHCGPDVLGVADQVLGKQTQRQSYGAGSILGTTLGSTPLGEVGLGTERSWAVMQPQEALSQFHTELWSWHGPAELSWVGPGGQDFIRDHPVVAGCRMHREGTRPWVRQLKATPGEGLELRLANRGNRGLGGAA